MYLAFQVAWRNLWRNKRRTFLTSSAIMFAVMILTFSMSMQNGSYSVMIDNATSLLQGHIQIQHKGYLDTPKMRLTVEKSKQVIDLVHQIPGIIVTERASSFALASSEAQSFGLMLLGVDPRKEQNISTLSKLIIQGRYLDDASSDEIVIGAVLAKKLNAKLGDELVLLGSDKEGSLATLVPTVVGLFDSGQKELDRQLAQIPLNVFRENFNLNNQSHMLVLRTNDINQTDIIAKQLRHKLSSRGDLRVLTWGELMPGLEQSIELDQVSANLIYFILALVVVFSIVNTFVMTILERGKEFGVMLALGSRPGFIILMLQLEALFLCLVGVAFGTILGVAITLYLESVGIGMGDAGELMKEFHMPDRLYPSLDFYAVVASPILMIIATQFAAILPGLRIRRIDPVTIMREE